jgi:hypothetical protein
MFEETDAIRFCKHCGTELFFIERFGKQVEKKTIPQRIWERVLSLKPSGKKRA